MGKNYSKSLTEYNITNPITKDSNDSNPSKILTTNPIIKDSNDSNPSKILTIIDSKINEIFAKTLVTQKFSNITNNPLELKIYVFKKEEILFSSFYCQIGDSIKVVSKVIKKEKAEQKYTDSIASGNAAIFVGHDPDDENKIIINMGNIPPKSDVVFISEFIYTTESSNKKYEFEIFRNLPIFVGKDNVIYENCELKGKINIKLKNEIINIEKNILMKNLTIVDEKYKNEKRNDYIINYKIDILPSFSWGNLDYIPSSKIYFDSNQNEPLALIQKYSFVNNETSYFIQYKFKREIENNTDDKKENENNPALFIFLVDQSGSMRGTAINICSKALLIFLQSLPVGSYYQIIGFGSNYELYDKIPKEYNKENINNSIKIIEGLKANLGGTNIYSPLEHIYNDESYDKINLPRNIFLLTDGGIDNKKETLELIERNNKKFIIYSIGIGNRFDEDLIKNAGILGKGNYNFCKDTNNLTSIIVSEINKSTSNFVTNLKIHTNLDDNNFINNNKEQNIFRNNEIFNLYYIKNDKNIIDKIELNVKYKEMDNKDIEKNIEIIAEKIENGEDLTKLIINNYITHSDLSEEEKLKLALKYQIFTKETSLFAEVELSNKISEKMKLEILGDKENNIFKKVRQKKEPLISRKCNFFLSGIMPYTREKKDNKDEFMIKKKNSLYNNYNDSITINKNDKINNKISSKKIDGNLAYNGGFKKESKNKSCCVTKFNEENIIMKKNESNGTDSIMKMINTQDFIEGSWEENEYTKKIIEKYKKEYELLKGLKNKNMNDKIALTILIIYYINKEHSNLLNDLIMIMKKAKLFIHKNTNDNYENLIKEVGLN